MKKNVIFTIILMALTLMTAKAQVNESELIGNRFEICQDFGGLDGCETRTKIKFNKNGIGEMQIKMEKKVNNGFEQVWINGFFIWQLYCGKNIMIYPLDNSFRKDYNLKIDETVFDVPNVDNSFMLGEIAKKNEKSYTITFPFINLGNKENEIFEKELQKAINEGKAQRMMLEMKKF